MTSCDQHFTYPSGIQSESVVCTLTLRHRGQHEDRSTEDNGVVFLWSDENAGLTLRAL